MFQPLNGPALQGSFSVNTSTVQEVKIGGSTLAERKVITIQPLTGAIYLYFGNDNIVPNAATVIADGFQIPRTALRSFEASDTQKVYILAVTGTVTGKWVERA